jgi:hypothetical protein
MLHHFKELIMALLLNKDEAQAIANITWETVWTSGTFKSGLIEFSHLVKSDDGFSYYLNFEVRFNERIGIEIFCVETNKYERYASCESLCKAYEVDFFNRFR